MQASKTLHLKLDRLGLQTFPLEIVAMSQLKSLDIRANDIQSLPSAIGKVRRSECELPWLVGGQLAGGRQGVRCSQLAWRRYAVLQ